MKKISKIILFIVLIVTFLVGCSAESKEKNNITDGEITKFFNNKVELTYNGERVDPLIALVDSEKEVSIKIKFKSENLPKKVDFKMYFNPVLNKKLLQLFVVVFVLCNVEKNTIYCIIY